MTALALINAQVHTMAPGHPHASGLLIQGGVISLLFREDGKPSLRTPAEVIDLRGKTVLPGLIDSHLHLRQYAENLQKIDCETPTRMECLDRVRERARITPPGAWILGHGWNHNIWPEGYGSAADLDLISTDHPIYLTGKSLHVSWANTCALELAGITPETPDPPGGQLGRDQAGKLTGILLENAVKLIEVHILQPGTEEIAQAIRSAQQNLWKVGLTGVHDFDRVPCLEGLRILEDRGQLGLRVLKSIPADFLPEALELGYQTGAGTDWLWFGGVKDFMDGALGPQTAALLAPYQGQEGSGLLLRSEDEIFKLGRSAAEGGLSLSIHAIGDLANHTLLNAIQRLREYEKERAIPPLPHRIEHLQLIDPQDIPRLAELKVTASMQPIHATSDMEMADTYWGDRCRYAYAPKYPLEQGARVIFGSDAPVEDPNPWLGIHAAVTRRRADGQPGPQGWHPEGRLSLQDALAAFSAAPGQAAGRGDRQGQLIPGFWADLIVLEEDPFLVSPDDLKQIRPCGTMINGEWAWRDFS
ncbi:MAG: amidohydrolase [Anaerolineales bacterium]